MALYGMGVVVAPIIGPTLGGWITDNYSWHWIFFINIPVGILSLLLTSLLIHDPPYLVRRAIKGLKIDYIGLGLLAVGLGFLQVVLDKGQREDWFSSDFIVWCSVLAVVGLVGALFWELTREDPIVDLRMLKERNFAIATFTMFMLGFVLYGSTVLLPIFLQTLMGYTAMLSGLVLSPGGLVTLLALPIVGRLTQKVEARWLVAVGLDDYRRRAAPHVELQPRHRFLDRAEGLDDFPHGHGLSVCAHQRHGLLLHPQRKDEQRHGHHQPGAEHRRQRRHRQRHHHAGAPRAVPSANTGQPPDAARPTLPVGDFRRQPTS